MASAGFYNLAAGWRYLLSPLKFAATLVLPAVRVVPKPRLQLLASLKTREKVTAAHWLCAQHVRFPQIDLIIVQTTHPTSTGEFWTYECAGKCIVAQAGWSIEQCLGLHAHGQAGDEILIEIFVIK